MPSEQTLLQDDEIEVEAVGGLFRGFVHNVDKELLVMRKALNMGTGVCLPGLKYFYKEDIISSKLIKSSDAKEKLISFRARSEIMKKSLEELKAKEAILFPSSQPPQTKSISPIQEKTNELIKLPLDKSHYRLDYIIIDKLDRFFYDSISDIKSHRAIGLAFIGSNLERGEDFSWVAVHVKNIYLYDISSLRRSVFIEGLTEVFEDPNIVKVMFDCRLPSRVLLNKHSTLITNVLDLQVLDVFAESFSQSLGRMPKKLSSLLECLTRNIDVPVGEITSQMRRMDEMKNSQYWKLKPTNQNEQFEEMIQAIIFEVGRLKDLRKSLMERLMKVVVDGVDVFLSLYRDSSDLRNLLSNRDSVPLEFHDRLVLRNCAEESRKKTERLIEGRKLKEENEKSEGVQRNYVTSGNSERSSDSESKIRKVAAVGSPLELDWINKKTQSVKSNFKPSAFPWSRLVKTGEVEVEESISMVPDGCEMGSICYRSKKYNYNNYYNNYKEGSSFQRKVVHNGNDPDCRSDVDSKYGSNGHNREYQSDVDSKDGLNRHIKDFQYDEDFKDSSNGGVDSHYEVDFKDGLNENSVDSQCDVNVDSSLNSRSKEGMKNSFGSRNIVSSRIFSNNVQTISRPRENSTFTNSLSVPEGGKLEMNVLQEALFSALHYK